MTVDRKFCLLAVFCLLVDQTTAGNNWAVLVASSDGWENYRHEANVCHAFHLLRAQGIAEERIVLMMVDDIAHAPQYAGQLFNSPAHRDVYAGCRVDYRGEDVTIANFLAVLRGDAAATGGKRVLESTAEDRVFVYLTDHGGDGIVTFPEFGHGLQLLNTTALAETVHFMHTNKKFGQLVVYWEACHSSTMFDRPALYPPEMNVYIVTSAKGKEEKTHETYFDPELQVSLSDQFSAAWLEDSEANNPTTRTLQLQFEAVKKRVANSTVLQWGNLEIARQPLAAFQGTL
ncbi:hypothetical protein M3Y99_01131100 [Aphelenchoides fujianensis]|nr:hypothetical protein M3Y99_01131100 [Aphelenchoides fujianensis]